MPIKNLFVALGFTLVVFSYSDDIFAQSPSSNSISEKASVSAITTILKNTTDPQIVTDALDTLAARITKGDGKAALALGELHRDGIAVQQNIPQAIDYYNRAKDLGEKSAYSKLGDIYFRNSGVLGASSTEKAMDFYKQGTAEGDVWSMIALGDVYAQGKLAPQDIQQALLLYKKANSAGSVISYFKIGDLYYKNSLALGVETKLAIQFFEDGANKNDTWAMIGLGDSYRDGKGIGQDLSKSLSNYKQAAAGGNKAAYTKLGDLYYRYADKLGADRHEALSFYQSGFEKGDTWAIIGLGDIYRDGEIVVRDFPKSASLYQAAVAKGNTAAFNKLGELYTQYAKELDAAPARGIDFYRQGIGEGNASSMVALGDIYQDGKVTARDLPAALSLYEQANSSGSPAASFKIGQIIYLNSTVLKIDPGKSIGYFKTAALAGNKNAALYLANIYRDGRITKKDTGQALAYYRKSFEAGNLSAYAQMCDMLIQGSSAEKRQGLALVKAQLGNKDLGLNAVWANANLYGQGMAPNPRAALSILKDGWAKGDSSAALRLSQLYATGYGKVIPKRPRVALDILSKLNGQISDDRLQSATLFVLGVGARSTAQMQAVTKELWEVDPPQRTALVRRVSGSNSQLYIYILQDYLKRQGRFSGSVNGILSKPTRSLLVNECQRLANEATCRKGPLNKDTREALLLMLQG